MQLETKIKQQILINRHKNKEQQIKIFQQLIDFKNQIEFRLIDNNNYSLPGSVIKINQGESKLINFRTGLVKNLVLKCNDKEVKYLKKSNHITFLLFMPHFQEVDFLCSLNQQKILTFSPNKVDFSKTKINLRKNNSIYSRSDLERINSEKQLLDLTYSTSHNKVYFNSEFTLPVLEKYTTLSSNFADKRIFLDGGVSYHTGIDFLAPGNALIFSINRGQVVLAQDLFFCGKTIVIDHGLDLFSVYCHLSKINTKIGRIVEKGEVIGRVGSTGRSTGEHLHLSVRNKYYSTNPLLFFSEIKNKLSDLK